MKKYRKSLLAFFLVVVMTFSSSGIGIYAATTTEKSSKPVSSKELETERIAANKKRKEGKAATVKNSTKMISNDYIQCVIDDDGEFNIGTADGDCLLYNYPYGKTSETLIRIDSTDYLFNDYVTDVTAIGSDECVATAEIENVKIEQILQIENNPSTSKKDLISIKYRYTNRSEEEKKIGVRIMIDTMLGSNDGAPFKINGVAVTTEREYFGETIPKIYQAMDSLTNPDIVATGYLYYNAGERPDKVQFASWPNVCGSSWGYAIDPKRSVVNDSAVAVYFDRESLSSGATKTVLTRYGVYNSESANGYDRFDYDNNTYSQELAEQLAVYAALAYQDYQYVSLIDNFYAVKNAEYYRLKDRLKQDGFSNFKKYNYTDPTENGATFNFASKKVNYKGTVRNLVVVSVRGTNKIQWKGNMNLVQGGSNGPFNDDESYSFLSGEKQVKQKLKEYCNSEDIKNAMVLVTGHSRGGAIGNLLAADLTKNGLGNGLVDEDSVYAYLFAVPNCTRKPDKNMTNIFNFCFTDDFVPSVPLNNKWNYDKNGKTFTKSAKQLYKNNVEFQDKAYESTRLSEQRDPSFKLQSCQDLIRYIGDNWTSVDEYYTKKVKWTGNNTLYLYMHNVIAPAAMGDLGPSLKLAAGQLSGKYQKIADYFVDGTHAAYNVNDNHQMYTYYDALRTNCFDTPQSTAANVESAEENEDEKSISGKSAVTFSDSDEEKDALKAFANQGSNATILGWNFEDGYSLSGIILDEETNRVTEIDLEYPESDENEPLYLEGNLDLSAFSSLKKVKIAGNHISELILPTQKSSVLEYLDCSHNALTALSVQGAALKYCNAEYNELGQDTLKQMAALSGNIEIYYENQKIPQDAEFANDDVAKLKTILTDEEIWDPETPGSWPGVVWTNINGTYYVTRLELSGYELSGAGDFSGFSHLQYLDCSANNLSSLDVSNCGELDTVQCCANNLTTFTVNDSTHLQTLYCSGNKLPVNVLDSLQIENKELGWQGVSAEVNDFDEEEYAVLSSFSDVMQWTDDDPGSWQEVQWKLGTDGKYHVVSLDLAEQKELTGELDLTVFSDLESFKLTGSGFSEIILPNTMEELPEQVFFGCVNLKDITLPSGLKSISKEAFRECSSLENVFLPATVTKIAEGAFRCCTALNGIYFTGNAPTDIGENAFLNVGPSFTIYNLKGTTGFDREFFESFIRQSIDDLSIYQLPDKMNYYLGETLNMDGLVLLKLGTDGSHRFIETGYTYDQQRFDSPGVQSVAVSYEGAQVEMEISVSYPDVELTLSSGYKEMEVNDVDVLEVTAKCEDLSEDILKENITWESSDPSIVMVEADQENPFKANIKALKVGYCSITAKIYENEISADIDVVVPITGLKLNDITVGVCQWKYVTYEVQPADASQNIDWTSSDESIAEVYEDGRIYGKMPGICTVTARAGNISAFMRVTVVLQPKETIQVTKSEQLDSNTRQTGRGYDNNMDKLWTYTVPGAQNITISLSKYCELEDECDYLFLLDKNNKVLYKWTGTEAAGKTVTVSGDTVKIYMKTDGSFCDYYGFKVDKVDVTYPGSKVDKENVSYPVTNPSGSNTKISKISLDGISHNIAASKKIKLTAKGTPAGIRLPKLLWSTSNKKVATVTQSGIVTIKKKTGGKSVIIRAKATNGSGLTATWKIKSMKGVVKKVSVSGAKTVKAGKSLKLKAKVTATKGANKKLKWICSNTKYAMVNSKGIVKTKKAGKGKKVKITAMATDGSNKKKTVTIKIK